MDRMFSKIILPASMLCALLLAGCGTEVVSQTIAPEMNTAPAETTVPVATEEVTEITVTEETSVPTETQVPATTVPQPSGETENEADALPYLLQIHRADQSVFEGPGYDYVFVGTVRERGTYTIVEECPDREGNLWGRLKSGMGWVNLTEIRSEEYANALISANYADDNLLLHGAYHHYSGNDPEYSIAIAFRVYGTLRDVALFDFAFSGEAYLPNEEFFCLPEWNEEMPLVAELAFPGDMTMYGIRFVDENGNTHVYSIYISGRNGALVLTEYQM